MAVKCLFTSMDNAEVKAFYSEVQILRTLRHPNIVLFLGAYMGDKGISLSLSCIVWSLGWLEPNLTTRCSSLQARVSSPSLCPEAVCTAFSTIPRSRSR